MVVLDEDPVEKVEYFLKVARCLTPLMPVLFDVSHSTSEWLESSSEREWTEEELKKYTGVDPNLPILLGFNGVVLSVLSISLCLSLASAVMRLDHRQSFRCDKRTEALWTRRWLQFLCG